MKLYKELYFKLRMAKNNEKEILAISRNVMADVNGLKLVNDSFGHTIGDELFIIRKVVSLSEGLVFFIHSLTKYKI